MLVSSQKGEEDGPAPIPMSLDTEYLMNVFIDKLRPLVTENTSAKSKIFLKNDGTPFQKGTIGRRVRAFVVKSGIWPDKAIAATDFRKWIVTELKIKKRMGMKIDEQLLRRLMCHSDKTANEWYLRESLTQCCRGLRGLSAHRTTYLASQSRFQFTRTFQKTTWRRKKSATQDIVLPKANSATYTL